MKVIDGRKISQDILSAVKREIEDGKYKPSLKIIIIGSNPSSLVYCQRKKDRGLDVGISVEIEHFADDVEISQVESSIRTASDDNKVDGIIIQLPVKNKKIKNCFNLIPVNKDVDGLNPLSLGMLWHDKINTLIPATVKAIVKVLENIAFLEKESPLSVFLSGKSILIINRSLIIGKPLAAILLNNDATVTVAHSKTINLQRFITNADIIISATGVAGFMNKFDLPRDVILIDAGFNYVDGKVVGDVKITPEIEKQCQYLSPVPNGVGPIGVACLLENTLISKKGLGT